MQRTRMTRDARWWSWVVMHLCATPSMADRRSKLPLHAVDSSTHCPLLPPMWPSSSVHYWLVGSSFSPTPEDGDVCMYTCVLEIGELVWWCVRAAASSSGLSNSHPRLARWGVAVCLVTARRNVIGRIPLLSCREVTQLRVDLEAPSPRRHSCRTNVLLTAQAFSRSSCLTILKGKME
ncbi:uncharacterized protein LOC125508602 isoform X3 [Triticum urartu]|uniref:uncharacterized protein LOC125508602 isoform X3 n=1 Tax=Triticum urartu TaxID=4572 RepID=UPI0020434A2A|nr:uncharacterized protein LOC125508602 isoform X3 [Triticum urartu]